MQGHPQPQRTPGGVTAVAVIAFIYGLLGFVCSAYGAVSAGSAADQIRAQKELMSNMPNSPFANTDFYDSLIANAEALTIPTVIVELLAVFVAIAVVVVGAMVLTRKPAALKLLPPVFMTAIGYSVLYFGYSVFAAMRQSSVLEEMASAMGGSGAAQVGSALAGAGVGIGACIGAAWLAAKLAYFIGSLVYFRKPHIRAIFDPTQAPSPGEPHYG